jgi:hypothetical protein
MYVLEGDTDSATAFADCTSLYQLHYCWNEEEFARGNSLHGCGEEVLDEVTKALRLP